MRVIEFANPTDCFAAARPFLLQRECERCVQLGVLQRLIDGKSPLHSGGATAPVLFGVVDGTGDMIGLAMQTPPAPMIVTSMPDDALTCLREHLLATGWRGPLNGPTQTVAPLVWSLAERWRTTPLLKRTLRVFRCDRVIEPASVPGAIRQLTSADEALVARFAEAFWRDVNEPPSDALRAARMIVDERRGFAWDDGQPRAMAVWSGPTPNGIRVSFVYTPPENRGRGFASNLTAALTKHLFASGRKFCFLFTDLANPTSNRIYQQIGYVGECDFQHWGDGSTHDA
jgi:hypothetical protein